MNNTLVRPETNFLIFDVHGFEQAVGTERKATLERYGLKRLLQWTLHCTQETHRDLLTHQQMSLRWPDPMEVERYSRHALDTCAHDFTSDGLGLIEESIHRTVLDLYLYLSQLLHQCGYLPAQALCTSVFAVRESTHVVLKTTGDHRYATWH